MFSPVVYLYHRVVLSQDAFKAQKTVNGYVLLKSKQFFYSEKGALLHSPSVLGFIDPGFQGHLYTVVKQNLWDEAQGGEGKDLPFVIEVLRTEPAKIDSQYQGAHREELQFDPVPVKAENTLDGEPYAHIHLGSGILRNTLPVLGKIIGDTTYQPGYRWDLSTEFVPGTASTAGVRVLNPITVPKGYRVILLGRSRSFRNGLPLDYKVLFPGQYSGAHPDLFFNLNTDYLPTMLLGETSLVQALVFKA